MSARHRPDIVAAGILAIAAFSMYSWRAARPSPGSNEKPLGAAVDLLSARGGHDDAGRFLPLLVRIAPDEWLPPVPPYATMAITKIAGPAQPARRATALFAACGLVLMYYVAAAVFGRRWLGWMAALLLLCTPAFVLSARQGSLDGMWVIPPLLLSLAGVAKFAANGSQRWLAIAAAAVASCVYAQPSGALVAVIVGAAEAIGLARARLLTVREALRAGGVVAGVMMPLALWLATHPASYADTFGRWLLHPAYIRNPWSLVIRLTNWFSLSEWASIYWNFFDPTKLLYSATTPAAAGTFLMPLGVFLAIAMYDLARSSDARTPPESVLLWIAALGFVASPLVPASFSEPGAIHKALSLTIFGMVLGTHGVRVAWARPWGRTAAVLLLALACVQFVAFYRSVIVVSTGAS